MAEEIKKEEEIKEEEEKEEEEIEDEPKTYSEDDYKKLQSESMGRKKTIKELKEENEKFKKDKLTESELKDLKIKELETEKDDAIKSKNNADTDALIMEHISTKGFNDVPVAKLVVKEELKLEEEITEVTIKKAVDKVAKDKPYLIGGENTDINKGNFKKGDKPDAEKSIDARFGDALRKGLGRNIL